MGAEVRIVEVLEPIVQASGLEIWDVERSGTTVRVMVDRSGGVDLESLAALSREISDALDQRDDLVPAGRYELDVSSPGIERRLRYPEHFARCVGQQVAVKTYEAIDGNRRFEGLLQAANAGEVTIVSESTNGSTVDIRLPLEAIERAHTVFRWGSTDGRPKPKKQAGQPRVIPGGPKKVDAAATVSKEA